MGRVGGEKEKQKRLKVSGRERNRERMCEWGYKQKKVLYLRDGDCDWTEV